MFLILEGKTFRWTYQIFTFNDDIVCYSKCSTDTNVIEWRVIIFGSLLTCTLDTVTSITSLFFLLHPSSPLEQVVYNTKQKIVYNNNLRFSNLKIIWLIYLFLILFILPKFYVLFSLTRGKIVGDNENKEKKNHFCVKAYPCNLLVICTIFLIPR